MSQDNKAQSGVQAPIPAAKWQRYTFKAVASEREYGAKHKKAGQTYEVPMIAVIDRGPRSGAVETVHQAMSLNSATAVQEALLDIGLTENALYESLSEAIVKAMTMPTGGGGSRLRILG